MPRQATGYIEARPWKDGKTISWRLHVSADGRSHKLTLGTNHEGWNEVRAEVAREEILAQIRRGTWTPPEVEAAQRERAASAAAEAEKPQETIHVTLSRWWQGKKREVAPNTRNDYRWRLDLLLAFRPQTPTAEIDEQWVDELRDWLADRPAHNRTAGQKLAPSSVNKPLSVLAQALDLAKDHKVVRYNAARGKRRKYRGAEVQGCLPRARHGH
ncbi:MAG: phage integrase SAM-like domain-containing protein [Solirubrobacterales bacterium]|nr:phage integrase SAM-like domain-containing protein [Solirubrobacterales bacterium]